MKNTENNGAYFFITDKKNERELLEEGIKVSFSTDSDNKKFTFIKLDPPDEKTFSNPVSKTHISIYPQKNDHKKGLSAYHYTANLKKDNQEFTVHVYFDSLGNYVDILVKDDAYELTEEEQKLLINFAKRSANKKISTIISKKEEHIKKLDLFYQDQEKELSKIHEKLNDIFENEKIATTTLNDFKNNLELCLLILEKFNLLSEGKKAGEEKILRDMLANADTIKLNIKQETKNKVSDEKLDLKQKNTEKALTVVPVINKVKKPSKKQKEKLNKILELEQLDKVEDIMELYQLLDEKFKKTSQDNHMELLDSYAKMNACLDKASKKLSEIIKENKLDTLKKLLKICPNIDIPFRYYYTIIEQENIDMLDYVLSNRTINLDHYGLNLDGDTLLCCAMRNKKFDIAEYLLKKGANPDMPNLRNGATPFFLVITFANKKLITLFLKYNANPNLKAETPLISGNKDKNTSLFFIKTEESLLDKINPTVFMSAVLGGDLEIIELLLSNKNIPIDLSIKNKHGFTTFGIAVRAGYESDVEKLKKILELLIKNGSEIDEIQGKGEGRQCSALSMSCQAKNFNTVKILIQLEANPNSTYPIKASERKELYNMSPFEIAIYNKNDAIINYLITQEITPLTKVTLKNSLKYCGNNEKLRTRIQDILLEKYNTKITI
jgi:ankyrin repeat protein